MLAFMEETQQYSAVSEVVVVVRLLHEALWVPEEPDKSYSPDVIDSKWTPNN